MLSSRHNTEDGEFKRPLARLTNVLKDKLDQILSDVESSGTFLTSRSFDAGINPGLEIPGVGLVPLPLSPDAAKAIIGTCHASPYGKGSETLVNESVRKTWELNADQFFLRNPAWQKQLNEHLKEAVEGLGLTADPHEIRAELYKMLLYEEGAFFLPHQDSEKADGMFGTLVISLPSKHEGGDVIASHKGEQKVFNSSTTSEFGFSYAAWYSDVTHEVKPVTAGYRLVLTYNLIHRPSAAILANRDDLSGKLQGFFNAWASHCETTDEYFSVSQESSEWLSPTMMGYCPTALVWVLDHQYTEAELSFARLKGVDQNRVGELRKACEQNGFYIYLANIKKEECVSADDGYWGRSGEEVYETSLDLMNVVDAADNVFIEEIDINESLLVQENIFDRDPDDEEEYEGFTGNEGASTTRVYHETGVIFIPEAFHFAFKLHAVKRRKLDVDPVLSSSFRAVIEHRDDKKATRRFLQLCRVIIHRERWAMNAEWKDQCNRVAMLALEIDELEFFKECANVLGANLSASVGPRIGKIICVQGLPALHPVLNTVFSSSMDIFEQLRLLFNIISAYSSQCQLLGRDKSKEVVEWQDGILSRILSSRTDLKEEHGTALVHIVKDYPADGLLQRIIPFLITNISNSAFIIAFLTSLREAAEHDNTWDSDEVAAVYSNILPTALQYFRFAAVRPARPAVHNWIRKTYDELVLTRPADIVKLIEQCHAMNLDTNNVFGVLKKQAMEIPEADIEATFHQVLLPFVNSLCHYMKSETNRPSTDDVKDVIVSIVVAYMTHYVKPQPQRPSDWRRTLPRTCSCADCALLRRFVEDPNRDVGNFPMAEKRRKHLECQLDHTFTVHTIRSGSPHTLQVTKTTRRYEGDLKAWKERVANARLQLKTLSETSPFTEIVGDDHYERLLDHPNLKYLPASAALEPSNTSRLNTFNTPSAAQTGPETGDRNLENAGLLAGAKGHSWLSNSARQSSTSTSSVPRKRSFVDLTEDK